MVSGTSPIPLLAYNSRYTYELPQISPAGPGQKKIAIDLRHGEMAFTR
jgi:hypothetical protein